MTDKLAKAEQMKQSLKVADTGDLRLETMADMEVYCRAIADSGMTPYRKWTEVFTVMQTARDLGLKPSQAFRGIYIVNHKPALEGHLALALIRASDACEYFKVDAFTDETAGRQAVVQLKRKGEPPEVVSFDERDAKRAGLWGKRGPWTTHPDDMLIWKAVSRAAKRYFSDVIMGLDLADVVKDYTESRSAAPERQPPSTPDPLLAEVVADDTFSTPSVGVDEELPPLDDDDAPDPFEPPPGALSTDEYHDPDDDVGKKAPKDGEKGLF